MEANVRSLNPVHTGQNNVGTEITTVADSVQQAKYDLEQSLATLFLNQLKLHELARNPEGLKDDTLERRVLSYLKLVRPASDSITFIPKDFTTLIHPNLHHQFIKTKYSRGTASGKRKLILNKLKALARVSLTAALDHRASNCNHCKYLPSSKICIIVQAASQVNDNPDPNWISAAIAHVVDCKSCSYADAYDFLQRAVCQRPVTVPHFSAIAAQMACVANGSWVGDAHYRFVDIVSQLNVYLVKLPKQFYLQGSSELLGLALAAGKIGRKIRTHEMAVKLTTHSETNRISIHANRRFRWLYFLFITVAGDGHEYRFVKAHLQYGQGSIDFPACHSILGGLDRKKPQETQWKLGQYGQTFERFSFFKAMNTTVELSAARNQLDIDMEQGFKPYVSDLLTNVAQEKQSPDDAFELVGKWYAVWAGQNRFKDFPYIEAHLSYLSACGEDPLPSIPPN